MYTPNAIDPVELEKAIDNSVSFRREMKNIEVMKLEAFFEGYQAASDNIIKMLHCSNYEKKEGNQ